MKSYHSTQAGREKREREEKEKRSHGFVLPKHLGVVAVSWQKPNQARLDCMVGVLPS